MASGATTKAARRAAREAVVAAQADLARRNRANMDDLAVFLSARQRADAVDDWFKERVAGLKVQADERRAGQLRECGVALRAMRDRGESVREIARMAGIGEKTVRELIRSAGAEDATADEAAPGAGGPEANGHNGVVNAPHLGAAERGAADTAN
ncbi:hypothetical protein [Mycobacterium sp. 29Ha]|uniref:hypothetical protein n=1 Tax=Mycobacterium sp. 29Ha TaxID=2939268 RepID=UPI0029394E5A|nr:hypothetical protein [Mycobacterium sp. 29Ha]MDV3133347.1 hypothetical protein [Mycobacterium sp. 29Ha]